MRFRTFVFWLVALAIVAWVGYTIVVAGSLYLEMGGLVDRAIVDALQRRKAQLGAGMPVEVTRDFTANIRVAITTAAKKRGLELDPGSPQVVEVADSVRVTVKWYFPLKVYGDYTISDLPMSVTRAHATT